MHSCIYRLAALLSLAAVSCVPAAHVNLVLARAAAAARVMGAAGPGNLPLSWATYLGGLGNDGATAVATDRRGNVYVAGETDSGDFPITRGAAQAHYRGGGKDAFLVAYTAVGRLRWATYLGGSGDDHATAIAVDGRGNIYVTGHTGSRDFPATAGAAQPRYYGGGTSKAFVTSYDSSGHVRWSTYLGGKADNAGRGIVVDRQGNVYVTGETSSADFPVTTGTAQPNFGGAEDVFVASYNSDGHARWSTYLGGAGLEYDNGIAVDRQDNVYVIGDTTSADFPVTAGTTQPNLGGATDAFMASYDSAGHIRWAAYLGGKNGESGRGITVDSNGTVYVTGFTSSPDFTSSPGAAQPQPGGSVDAFVASYDSGGHMRWATYLGGSGDDRANAAAADDHGNVYVAGSSNSADFPVSPDAVQPRSSGSDRGFVAAYTSAGLLRSATILDQDGNYTDAITTDGQHAVYITGYTTSSYFPVTPGAAQTILGAANVGITDAFLVRTVLPRSHAIAFDPASPPPSGTLHVRYFPGTLHALAGPFLAAWNRLGGISTLGLPISEPFTLAGRQAQVTERAVLIRASGGIGLLPLGPPLSAGRPFAPVPAVPNTNTRLYFPSSGHTLAGPFLTYWQAHQGSMLLGAPIAEPEREGLADGTGRSYLVQWFTNGRLELHPEVRDARYRVLQGRVGYEYVHRLGLL